jgi:transcriptional regulator with XRE-family HTH domain
MMTTGLRIRKLREAMGMSQTELARAAKVSQATVSDYETDEIKHHRASVLMKLAAALGTTPEYLVTGDGAQTIESGATDEGAMLDAFRKLDEPRRFALIAAAQAMLLAK